MGAGLFGLGCMVGSQQSLYLQEKTREYISYRTGINFSYEASFSKSSGR